MKNKPKRGGAFECQFIERSSDLCIALRTSQRQFKKIYTEWNAERQEDVFYSMRDWRERTDLHLVFRHVEKYRPRIVPFRFPRSKRWLSLAALLSLGSIAEIEPFALAH